LVVPTLWLLPDAFGFLVWEFKENWSLYRANRGKRVKPALVTDHGEGIRGLLQPGFHSGTIPKLYYRIRKAENRATSPRSAVQLNRYKNEITHYRDAVKRFVTRELIFLLNQSQTWKGQILEVGDIHLSTNRISIQLSHESHPKEPLEIEIEHHDGLLLAGFITTGWAANLDENTRNVLIACLTYFYKRSDIDVVREQVALGLPYKPVSVQIDNHTIFARSDWNIPPQEIPLANHPENATKFLFSRMALTWLTWDAAWETEIKEGRFPLMEPFKDCIFPLNSMSESKFAASVPGDPEADNPSWNANPSFTKEKESA
ncbi:MAG: hypothetical protein ACKO23_07705, partial [Gemmataceae bacterium]